ncbi:pentatricopeptide repeat-containing protein At3g05340-like [Selaginella moellendorffii]|uniref:pentatricopeptide repeat-containing protein At3g05340-like n=1 Tax=Selaginella moellendorffii TaxID=88036 RepID=UPI000D1CC6BD|nr:pentatricopeptide repeat-containing protein At3g05340-like [Selaginella moellendorffii]|eukprot:XP_024539658.1 pentatricopeptide repeat-containing protein At3g05340-like [Selaginella moellendorffii]
MVKAESLGTGAALHSRAFKSGYDTDLSVANALVDMYLNCGSLADARKVFDGMTPQDPVSWNALILGYVTNGEAEEALSIFETNSSCVSTSQTFCAALKACSSLAASALVSFYAKCGSIRDAWKVFQKVRLHDAVSWTVMILGLAESGQGELSLQLFHQMRAQGYKTDAPTFVAALKGSSSVGALEPLKGIHADISRCGLEDDPVVANGIVDGYGKAGDAAKAQQVFESLEKPYAVAWTSVIAAHSHDGDTRMVFKLFDEMQDEGLQPDGIALLYVLTACSHGGLVHQAKRYFMEAKYGVRPWAEHYHCMVDVLGRANELEEAVEMVKAMPCEASGVAWRTVLGACKQWKNAAVGKLAFDLLVEVEARHEAGYLLMEAIYASSGNISDEFEPADAPAVLKFLWHGTETRNVASIMANGIQSSCANAYGRPETYFWFTPTPSYARLHASNDSKDYTRLCCVLHSSRIRWTIIVSRWTASAHISFFR